MEKYTIIYKGKTIEIERLPNGKFKKPDISLFTHQGLGSVWLDAGRIPYEGAGDIKTVLKKANKIQKPTGMNTFGMGSNVDGDWGNTQGRFAPNLLCSDDVLNDGENKRSGGIYRCRHTENRIFDNVTTWREPKTMYNDSGSYSRYFSLDAWAAKNLPDSVNRTFPFMIVPKAGKREKNAGLDGLEDKQMQGGGGGIGDYKGDVNSMSGKYGSEKAPAKNHHPTCKPIKLMAYLIAIGSRPGEVVLDPFAGSGTTGIAAALADRRYILIEQDAEYVDISERRIKWHVEQAKADEQAQLKLDL